MIDTEEWDELDPLVAEGILCEIMQRMLDDFVGSAKVQLIGGDKDFHLTRTPLVLDAEGLQEALEVHEKARLELLEIETRSAARLVKSGEQGTNVSSSQGLFKMPDPKRR
jgi:hypothetical protein